MPELIDKQETLKKKCETCGYCESLEKNIRATHPDFVADKCNAYKFIAEQPTIDADPVRHGRWIDAHFVSGRDFYRCSECGTYIEKPYFANDYNVRYCPQCGARMDGGADNANN